MSNLTVMTDPIAWVNQSFPNFLSSYLVAIIPDTTPVEEPVSSSLILAAVLLALVVICAASKIGTEICDWINLPTVLGELVSGVVVGVSVLHFLVFPKGGFEDGVVAPFAEGTLGLVALFGVPVISAIFAGAALTATSIGITYRVLTEIGKLNTMEGQIIPGVVLDADILGLIFFVTVGAKTELGVLNPANSTNQEGLILAILLILVAIIGKMITGLTVD